MKKQCKGKKKDVVPGYRCRGRIWLDNNGQTFLGWGRITLLQRIHSSGSIAAAARSMEMSYKHAWDLISRQNQAIATGLYLFSVKDESTGDIFTGKFLVIK